MKPVFADTYYYLALVNAADRSHGPAVAMSRAITGRVVTGAWVLLELADGLASGRNRSVAVALIRSIRGDPKTSVVPFSRALLDSAIGLYERRPDKAWSLTDCMSFVAMQQRGLRDALTGDRHFEQAGFGALFR